MRKDNWPTYKPYTVEPIRTNIFGRTEFAIQCDGATVRTTNLSFQDAKDIAFLLNVAYTTGYMTGQLDPMLVQSV